MNQRRLSFHLAAWAFLAALLLSSCGRTTQSRVSFRMGERMQVGPLIYSAIESKWVPQLGDILHLRVPKQRFLMVKLTVTNSGGQEAAVPFLTLEDGKGNKYDEEQNGEGVDGWLGFLRSVSPAQTEEGWIVFDVPPNSYNLRVSANAGTDEQSLLIEIPFSIDSMNDAMPTAKQ